MAEMETDLMTATEEKSRTATPAGLKILAKFIEAEAAGRLCRLINGMDSSDAGHGLAIPRGDGGFLAAAQRLERQGAVRLVGRRHNRFVIITDAGRAALSASDPRP